MLKAVNQSHFEVLCQRQWKWLLALGLLSLILGGLSLGALVSLTLLSILFLGLILMVAGMVQLVDAFSEKQWKSAVWHALIGFAYVIGGGMVIYDPVLASAFMTALLAWTFIIVGGCRLAMAVNLRPAKGWYWLLLAAGLSIALGGLILFQLPGVAFWLIGLLIAIELMINGWACIFLALSIRSLAV